MVGLQLVHVMNYDKQFQHLEHLLDIDLRDQQHPLHIYTNEYWHAREKIAERFIKWELSNYLSIIKPSNTVLDLACGGAFFGRNIVQLIDASKFCCIDINPRQLNLARKLNSELIDVETYEAQLNLGKDPLPFASNSIDIAIMINSIYYLSDSQKIKLFKEVSRCVRPSGRFIFSIENSLYWRNTHPYLPPLAFFWLYPHRIAEKILIKKGLSEKLPKFNLHHHCSVLTYLRFLREVQAEKVTLLLTNTLEYDEKLDDHATPPFPNNDPIGVTINSRKKEIINYFNIFQHGTLGDKIYSKIAKSMIHLGLYKLPFLTAPRIVFLVQF